MVGGLAVGALAVGISSANAATIGNVSYGCYGIYFTTDWNQECGSRGATAYGYFTTIADCTAPQLSDKSLTAYRTVGNTRSIDGEDCNFGINSISTGRTN
jgi:hypothetical protein